VRKKEGQSSKALILLIIMILIMGATILFLYFHTRTDEIEAMRSEEKTIPLLFSVHQKGKSLFTELFIYHPITGKGAFFDIPGDLGLMIASEKKIDRLDTIYDPDRPEALRDAAESISGIDIPYHIIVDIADLEGIVDLMGGLNLFIANPVEYMEEEEIVLLPSGSVSLDGAKAVIFGTYYDSGESEIERINRRQHLSQSLFGKIGEESDFLLGDTAGRLFRKRIETNLDRRALDSYIKALSIFNADRVVFQRVLGTRRNVDGKELLFPHYEGRLVRETVEQTLISIASEEVMSDEELTLSLEILNGTLRNGLAGRTSTVYRSFGYEVVNIGNAQDAEPEVEKSYIVDHTGDITKAQRIANIIRCRDVSSAAETSIASVSEGGTVIDVTIVLGKDFDGRYCKAD
jgi:anionic cell wall polymer biosynthesis LytR-Cps2A-Psr (LCP) family protein